MDSELVSALQGQLNRERTNAQIYFYCATVCDNLAYSGFAKYFRKQAQDELGHAKKFEEFLVSKRIQPEYMAIGSIVQMNDLSALAYRVVATEQNTTHELKKLYELADGEDAQVCALLDTLLLEQIEEENSAQDLYDLVSKSDFTGWLVLDERYGNL